MFGTASNFGVCLFGLSLSNWHQDSLENKTNCFPLDLTLKYKNVFTLSVSFIGSYTDDEPDFPRRNNKILQKMGV